MCDGARSVVVGVPSPNVHLKRVSSGEPTGANESASGGAPVQHGAVPPSGPQSPAAS